MPPSLKLMGVRTQPSAAEPERPKTLALVVTAEELERLIDARVTRILTARAANTPSSAPAVGSPYLNVSETARLLRCSDKTVRRYVDLGRLTAVRLDTTGSARLLICRASVERALSDAA